MTTVSSDLDMHQKTADEMLELYSDLHAGACPVMHSSAHGGYFMVASHAALRDAAADWQTFSSAGGVTLPRFPVRNVAIEHDPPEHTYWRGLFRQVLSVGAVRAAEPAVRADADELIDAFAERGTAELVAELAEVLPARTICRILGVTEPERITEGCHAGVALVDSIFDPANAQQALGAFAGFCMREIAERREHPRDDYLTRLGTADMDGHRLTDDEIVGLLIGFFFAGHHTTTAGLASMFRYLATDSALRDRLIADPTLIPRAAEEAVRIETPLHGFFRQATHDTEVAGCPIPAGSEVLLNYAAGNRDPQVFEAPEQFRVDRKPNPHLGFGHGLHTCVGAALARMQLRVVTEVLLGRLPDLVSTGEPPVHRWGGGNVMSVDRVPVTFTPEARSTH